MFDLTTPYDFRKSYCCSQDVKVAVSILAWLNRLTTEHTWASDYWALAHRLLARNEPFDTPVAHILVEAKGDGDHWHPLPTYFETVAGFKFSEEQVDGAAIQDFQLGPDGGIYSWTEPPDGVEAILRRPKPTLPALALPDGANAVETNGMLVYDPTDEVNHKRTPTRVKFGASDRSGIEIRSAGTDVIEQIRN